VNSSGKGFCFLPPLGGGVGWSQRVPDFLVHFVAEQPHGMRCFLLAHGPISSLNRLVFFLPASGNYSLVYSLFVE
jgi:hypothetical protein